MTREERLRYCKVCNHQQFDLKKGVICGLTNERAEFNGICESYSENTLQKEKYIEKKTEYEIIDKTAPIEKRFLNYFLDFIFLLVFSFLLGMMLAVMFAIFAPSLLDYFDSDDRLIEYLFAFIAGMIYYSTLEVTTGRTLAKFITRTKVVDEKGNTPGFTTILARSACRFIPLEPISFLGGENSGWHDRISKTKVIEV